MSIWIILNILYGLVKSVKNIKNEPLDCASTHKVNIESLKFLINIILILFNACLNIYNCSFTYYPLILA